MPIPPASSDCKGGLSQGDSIVDIAAPSVISTGKVRAQIYLHPAMSPSINVFISLRAFACLLAFVRALPRPVDGR